MNQPIFITGIGTGVGKTLVSAIVTESLEADYWKPIQAGLAEGTDAKTVRSFISNISTVIHPATYELLTPASPHIAARIDGVTIEIAKLLQSAQDIQFKIGTKNLVVEGAGGLLVPLQEHVLLVDFIRLLQAKVILVSRNYLGSINHSLLTAAFCRSNDIEVMGWIFTDTYLDYEDEIVQWSGYPKIASVPKLTEINKDIVALEAQRIKQGLEKFILN